MDKIEQIKEAIEKAKRNESKLSHDVLNMQGFTSHKIKHLLNNLGAISKRYLEIGLHKASTFCATLYDNECVGVGIDDWSQFQQDGFSKAMAYANCMGYLKDSQYIIIEKECFSIDELPFQFDMFNYDGEHSFENQKRGITHFYPFMRDEFILCVDDTSWKDPKEGTKAGIKECGLEILFEEHLWDGKENGIWHNGFSIYLLKK